MLTKPSMDWFDACYAGDERDWRYSPLVKSQQGMPPTLVTTASLDPIRDQGRAYAAACAKAGVPTIFQEAEGNIHGFINLRRAIPSSAADIARGVAALKLLLQAMRRMSVDKEDLALSPGRGRDAAQPRGQGVRRAAAR